MKEQLILSPFSIEELSIAIRKVVNEEVRSFKENELMQKFISPNEARKLFNPIVSIPTLDEWTRKGYLVKHYIGGRVYYKYCEIVEAVTKIKKYQRSI